MRACRKATPRTEAQLKQQVRLDLQRIARERRATCSAEEFRDTWLHAGFANINPKGTRVALLAGCAHLHDQVDLATFHQLYTDGAGTAGGEEPAAGWAAVRVPPGCTDAAHVGVRMGAVQCNPAEPLHWGARRLTNNTGELSALRAACEEIVTSVPRGDSAIISSDSAMSIGKLVAARLPHSSKNFALAAGCRAAYRAARRKLGPGRLLIAKVRGHSGHVWNNVADELAAEGRAGRTTPSATARANIEKALGAPPPAP